MTLREAFADEIARAIRGGVENGANYVGDVGRNDGTVHISANVDLKEVADQLIDWLNEHDIPTKWANLNRA